jgi:hypothetical protein
MAEYVRVPPTCTDCGPDALVWPCGDLILCTLCSRIVGDVDFPVYVLAPGATEPPPEPPPPPRLPKAKSTGWLGGMINVFDGCPDCGSGARIVEDVRLGEATCSECGLVIMERMMDYRPEWRSMSDADDPSGGKDRSRVGDAAGAEDLTLRIGDVASGSKANVRILHRHNMTASGKTGKARDVEAELRDMADVMRAYLMYREPMVELARQLYKDYNMEVQRVKGVDAKASAQAACAYVGSRVNGHSGERRDMEEVCIAFSGAEKDSAYRFFAQLQEHLAGKPYRDVLLRRTDIMDAAARRVWDLPPEILPQGLVRPVVNVTEWVRSVIGEDAAGTKDPIKFGNSVIAVAVVECVAMALATASVLCPAPCAPDDAAAKKKKAKAPVTGRDLAKELKIGAPTYMRNDDIIRRTIQRRAGQDALRSKVAEILKRCERVAQLRGARR